MTRKVLFEMFMLWCEEGQGKRSDYHNKLNAGINAALARIKDYDTDARESLKQEMTQSAELLDQAARLAMAAMLQVGLPLACSLFSNTQRDSKFSLQFTALD